MHETFEHTADLGLRIRSPDLPTLFIEAAQALFTAIVEDLATVARQQRVEVHLPPQALDYWLFDWLNELLFQFDTHHMLFCQFSVQLDAAGFYGEAWGEPLDRSRHPLAHEVKAITYHGLRVVPVDEQWLAEVIVDI
jgi:SHS2 domain-containing protein